MELAALSRPNWMLTRKQRQLKARYESQLEQERNGAPIPGEIAERMTRPKDEALFQCFVQQKGENGADNLVAVGPKGSKDFVEQFQFAILTGIASGKERLWTNPHVLRLI